VADSIRCLAEYVSKHADDYAVGMDDATGMEISMKFEIDCLPEIVVEKSINPYADHEVIKDERSYIWTRLNSRGDNNGDREKA